MNNLSVPLTPTEELQIEAALEKLFILQDRVYSEKKGAYFLEQLRESGYPIGAIIAGLTELMTAEIRTIRFHEIEKAIRDHLEPDYAAPVGSCPHCHYSGVIRMKFKSSGWNYTSILACICPAGAPFKKGQHALLPWNGQPYQVNGDRQLEII